MGTQTSKPSQNRRAVLRASLAAPVVLTVSSPTAATMTSLGRCLRNAAQEQPGFLSSSQDTWLRKQIDVYKLQKVEPQAAEKGAGKGGYQPPTEWVFLDEALQDYVTVAPPHTRLNLGVLMTDWKKVERSNRWALVWVDEQTKSVSMRTQIQPPSGGTAVTTSCWTSFKNAKPGWLG